MKPVEFAEQDEVYSYIKDGKVVPDTEIPVRHDPDGIASVWDFTDEERERIAAGATIELKTFGSTTPPLSMIVRGGYEDGDGIPMRTRRNAVAEIDELLKACDD